MNLIHRKGKGWKMWQLWHIFQDHCQIIKKYKKYWVLTIQKTIKTKMSMGWLFCFLEEVSTPPSLASYTIWGLSSSLKECPNSPWDYTSSPLGWNEPTWDLPGLDEPHHYQVWAYFSLLVWQASGRTPPMSASWLNPITSPLVSRPSWLLDVQRVLVNVLDHQTIVKRNRANMTSILLYFSQVY